MKKIIKEDKESGIIQITIADERWYIKTKEDGQVEYIPSVTWICSYYPKGVAFFKWLASKGWDESQAIKSAAGDKGSKVHYAIADLIDGKEVRMDSKYLNPSSEELEELTLEEYEAIMSFANWFKETEPLTVEREKVVFNDNLGYAGTIDYVCRIKDELWIIDFKTGQSVWPEHELQISAYKHALYDAKLGILQLGYKRNQKGWKFMEIKDKFDLFLAAKKIWAEECSKIEPLRKDYPTSLKLGKEVR